MIAQTPRPPYYAVIFTSTRTVGDNGYQAMAERMLELASQQDGYLGVENAHQEDAGITVSYWRDLASIQSWREHAEHTVARNSGRDAWYAGFKVRIAFVERDYDFEREPSGD